MKDSNRLYIIGNGFDIFHGLPCRYSDFKVWLENKQPSTFELLNKIYNTEGEWWKDFEVNIGKLDVVKLRDDFFTKMSKEQWDEYFRPILESHSTIGRLSCAPEYKSGEALKQLYDEIDIALNNWVKEIESNTKCAPILYLNKESSFISFNYTSLLEDVYHIPQSNILYIHGNNKKGNKLIWGHNEATDIEGIYHSQGKLLPNDQDMHQIQQEYWMRRKNPYEHVFKNDYILNLKPLADCIIVLGFSFSPVDEYYFWDNSSLMKHISPDAKWFISWYSEQDKKNVDNFFHKSNLLFRKTDFNYIRMSDLQLS